MTTAPVPPELLDAVVEYFQPLRVILFGSAARGDAEIGFQQISELLPVPGIEIVGPLPPGAQRVIIFSAGIATNSQQPEAAKQLIQFFASPDALRAIRDSGLEPAFANGRE